MVIVASSLTGLEKWSSVNPALHERSDLALVTALTKTCALPGEETMVFPSQPFGELAPARTTRWSRRWLEMRLLLTNTPPPPAPRAFLTCRCVYFRWSRKWPGYIGECQRWRLCLVRRRWSWRPLRLRDPSWSRTLLPTSQSAVWAFPPKPPSLGAGASRRVCLILFRDSIMRHITARGREEREGGRTSKTCDVQSSGSRAWGPRGLRSGSESPGRSLETGIDGVAEGLSISHPNLSAPPRVQHSQPQEPSSQISARKCILNLSQINIPLPRTSAATSKTQPLKPRPSVIFYHATFVFLSFTRVDCLLHCLVKNFHSGVF